MARALSLVVIRLGWSKLGDGDMWFVFGKTIGGSDSLSAGGGTEEDAG